VTDYDRVGGRYDRTRHPDSRIAARFHAALGDARTVVNVGAGTGSYEPGDRAVTAVEPSAAMIAARPAGSAPAVQASAEALPFGDGEFDAALGILTMQHWRDVPAGLEELRRVARRRIVLLTWDPEFDDVLWLTQRYFPRIREWDRERFPALSAVAAVLGDLGVDPVPVPHDCSDGFLGCFWRRPEAYLDAEVRFGMSGFHSLDEATTEAGVERLRADLASGEWERRFGHLRELQEMDLGYRLLVAGGGSGTSE
jgi:SAM-dependent methyltransferase